MVRNKYLLSWEKEGHMEEPTATGSNPFTTQRTTAKLPSVDATNNPNTNHSTTNAEEQITRPDNSLELIIIEGFQVGRGVARIDRPIWHVWGVNLEI